MSLSMSGIRGGQPSTTQPIATPWLAPKVVTRNRWAKVLNDILRFARMLFPDVVQRAGAGHKTATSPTLLTILRKARPAEHVDRTLLDDEVGCALRAFETERHHQRPRGATMRHGHGIEPHLRIPGADPRLHLGVAFAIGRGHRPFVDKAPFEPIRVAGLRLDQRRA